ncbi:MAG: T9SS type A sorting domain-containing protein [Bacteroidetes bacterium]|nr:MAG: T9SS type A sorting domain-containing protein [Bacteroidota bacterium]
MLRKCIVALIPFVCIFFLTSEKMSDDGRAGYTGSPGENDCTSCHGSFPVNTGGGSISLQNTGMPLNEYIAGQTYNLSVTVARSTNNLFGFAFEALTSLNDNAGTLNITDAAATQIKTRVVNAVTRRNVVHQLNAGAMSGSKTFNFSWTAPASGTGPVGFYFAGVAADGNGNDNNDYVYKSSITINEQVCTVPDQPSGISGNTAICSGSNHTYSVSPVAGATSYTWTNPSGWQGTSSTNTISLLAGNASGTLPVVANNACGSSQSSSVSLLVSNIQSAFSKTNVSCFGGSNGMATVNVSGGITPYTYVWADFPSNNTSTINNLPVGNYALSISDSLNCTTTTSVAISQPSVALTADAGLVQTICEGSSILLGGSQSASGGTSPYLYSWSPGSGLNSATVSNPLANPIASTNYSLLVTDNNGCTSTDNTTINVLPAAEVSISLMNDTLFASGGGPFQWYENGAILNGDTLPFVVPSLNQSYYVSTTYSNGCIIQSSAFFYSTISVSENDDELHIEIFPNPVRDHLTISIPAELLGSYFEIFNLSGQKVFEEILGSTTLRSNLNHLTHGFYIVRIKESGADKFFHKKLVKH